MSEMDVRALARRLNSSTLPLSHGIRGVITGNVTKAIEASAKRTNLNFEGRFRLARLLLAQELLKKSEKVQTFNELTDGEMKAISAWVRNSDREEDLDRWMVWMFGSQSTMRLE